ncbi:hypothetical protein [Neoroseomonas lacus]|nr:hypothetical protein [Neoroseomonas lacus]
MTARGLAWRRTAGAWRKLREAARRLDPGTVVLIGFMAGMGWAFIGSLGLGLGTGSENKVAAWSWLAGALLIGAAAFVALLLGAPPGNGDGA